MAQHIISVLNKVLPQEQAWKMKILRNWESILGPLSRKVVLQRIDDHAVILAVTHPSLAQELLMLSDLIREKINAAIGHEMIRTIHFRTTTARRSEQQQQATVKPYTPAPKPALSSAEQKHLAVIEGKELREALAAFYATCKERTST